MSREGSFLKVMHPSQLICNHAGPLAEYHAGPLAEYTMQTKPQAIATQPSAS